MSYNHSQEAAFTDENSDIFISRYGQIYNISDTPNARSHAREGVFFVAVAHQHILLNCPPWAPDCAEITGGGIKNDENHWVALSREIKEETQYEFSAEMLEKNLHHKSNYQMNYGILIHMYHSLTLLL